MKIGFLLARKTYLKTMGSLIEKAIKDGHAVILFILDPEGVKVDQAVSLEDLAKFNAAGAALVEVDKATLARQVISSGIDFLVCQEVHHNLARKGNFLKAIREQGIKVVSLSHFFETAKYPPRSLLSADQTFYLSDFARDMHFSLQRTTRQAEREKKTYRGSFAVTGSPMFDQLQYINADVERERNGINNGQSVVLFMLPVVEPTTPQRYLIWGDAGRKQRSKDALRQGRLRLLPEILFGESFHSLVEAIRDFCDRNGAALVIKSRSKQSDPAYIEQLADVYVDGSEEEYFPIFTSYSLMSFADLCVGANTMSVPEAVAVGVPALNIRIPVADFAVSQTGRKREYYHKVLSSQAPSLFNFPGCVTSVGRREIFGWLKSTNLEQVRMQPERRAAYVSRFLGIEPRPASNRILQKMMAIT